MTTNVLKLPPNHTGFAQARTILRNPDDYELDAIDAAFEVLVYSNHPEDKLLCEAAVEYIWEVPKPSVSVFLVVFSFMTVTVVSLAAILSELIK
jgi:hypothetical protein